MKKMLAFASLLTVSATLMAAPNRAPAPHEPPRPHQVREHGAAPHQASGRAVQMRQTPALEKRQVPSVKPQVQRQDHRLYKHQVKHQTKRHPQTLKGRDMRRPEPVRPQARANVRPMPR